MSLPAEMKISKSSSISFTVTAPLGSGDVIKKLEMKPRGLFGLYIQQQPLDLGLIQISVVFYVNPHLLPLIFSTAHYID